MKIMKANSLKDINEGPYAEFTNGKDFAMTKNKDGSVNFYHEGEPDKVLFKTDKNDENPLASFKEYLATQAVADPAKTVAFLDKFRAQNMKSKELDAALEAKKQNAALMRAIYAAREANKETPSEALTAKAKAIAQAIQGADPKVSAPDALQQAYKQLVPGRADKTERAFPPEVDKAAAAAYADVNITDTKALGAFDAKYPEWRATHFNAPVLKIVGAPTPATPGATTGRSLGSPASAVFQPSATSYSLARRGSRPDTSNMLRGIPQSEMDAQQLQWFLDQQAARGRGLGR
ncbi:MAG: hypothetical protein NUW01_10365, partial [Gemmatimonadaceae bacterium]|nr:hypothetical protein [Gemmatimonadaceae bacterium]